MVPSDFNDFFTACAGVSGALIGLLFVAISVAPEKMTTPGENLQHQIKAASAFSALINTLLISLFALIPEDGFGESSFILGLVGLASTVGLFIFVVLNRPPGERVRSGQILLILGTFVLYALQMLNGAEFWREVHDLNHITLQCQILIIFFIIAIVRAWEMVGAQDTSLWRGVATLARRAHSDGGTEGEPTGDPTEGEG